jgi:hypothetical protein
MKKRKKTYGWILIISSLVILILFTIKGLEISEIPLRLLTIGPVFLTLALGLRILLDAEK